MNPERSMIRMLVTRSIPFAVALTVTFAATPAAVAQDATAIPQKGLLPVPDYGGGVAERRALSGDWGGFRQQMAEKGVTLDVQWTDIFQGVTSGGREERFVNGGSLDYLARFDLMQMGVLPGALVTARAESRYGNTVNADTGLLLPARLR